MSENNKTLRDRLTALANFKESADGHPLEVVILRQASSAIAELQAKLKKYETREGNHDT